MDLVSPQDIATALGLLSDPRVLGWVFVGVLVGLVFGAAPGLTATAGVAIATPLTFGLPFESSMALLLGIFCAGFFAGSIPAILINTPGSPGNAATALDGYAMARRGEADKAIGLAVISSFVGGLFSVLILLTIAPVLAGFALQFTSVEYFSLALFGLLCVAAVSGGSLIKGAIAAAIGMLLGTVGIDPVGGNIRLTFGLPELLSGIPLIPALIAFFAISEILAQVSTARASSAIQAQSRVLLRDLLRIYFDHKWLALRAAIIGTFIGILPGTGPTIASWIGYGEAVRSARGGEKPGQGSPSGIIAPEAANNAVTGGAMVPLLTLGIPGDTVTAVLIGALLIQGIVPGPFFIAERGDLFVMILLALLLANFMILVIGLASRRYLSVILKIPPRLLLPIIGVLCAAGGFSISNSTFDVAIIAVFGVAGFVLLRFGFPMAPLVIGLVLGPIVETNLRNALTVHRMDATVFFTRPISAILLVGIVVATLIAWFRNQRHGAA